MKAFDWFMGLLIAALVASILIAAVNNVDAPSNDTMLILNPEFARAKAQQDMARAAEENNRLLREQIELQKAAQR